MSYSDEISSVRVLELLSDDYTSNIHRVCHPIQADIQSVVVRYLAMEQAFTVLKTN